MEKQIVMSSEKEEKDKTNEPQRIWSDLPGDILNLILSYLFGGDFSIFRAICWSWRSVTPVLNRPFPPPMDYPFAETPCLMILNDKKCKFFHPIYNTMYCMDIPEQSDVRIRYSNCGWLLMSHGEAKLFFFNPFTKLRIQIPELPEHSNFTTMHFSSPPTSRDCLVLGIEFGGFMEIGFIKRGIKSWTAWTLRRYESNEPFWQSDCSPVLYKGLYYCLGTGKNIGVLDLTQNCWKVYGKPDPWDEYHYPVRESFMVQSDGGMLAVFVSHEDRRVCVSRFLPWKRIWVNVQSLGNRMLCVGHGASLLEKTTARGMSNKIYFPKFHGNSAVFYSLSTRKYHSLDGSYTSKTSFNLIQPRNCTWIKPMPSTPTDFQDFELGEVEYVHNSG